MTKELILSPPSLPAEIRGLSWDDFVAAECKPLTAIPVERLSWDEFSAVGCWVLAGIQQAVIGLGDFALRAWAHFCPDLSQNQWTEKCGEAWGCDPSLVKRAMTRAASPIALPEDKTATWQYAAVVAGRGDEAATEALIDVALREGWSAYKIHLAATLYWEGLTDWEWMLPTFALRGDSIVARDGNGREETFARFEGDGDLAQAGRRLLRLVGRF